MTSPPPEDLVPLTGVPAGTPRFHPLQLPSAPFWVVLIGVIAATLVLIASVHALLVFMIGAALSFFLVPVVNWLQRKGCRASARPSWSWPRWSSSRSRC